MAEIGLDLCTVATEYLLGGVVLYMLFYWLSRKNRLCKYFFLENKSFGKINICLNAKRLHKTQLTGWFDIVIIFHVLVKVFKESTLFEYADDTLLITDSQKQYSNSFDYNTSSQDHKMYTNPQHCQHRLNYMNFINRNQLCILMWASNGRIIK